MARKKHLSLLHKALVGHFVVGVFVVPVFSVIAQEPGSVQPSAASPPMPVDSRIVNAHRGMAGAFLFNLKLIIDAKMLSDILTQARKELLLHNITGENNDPKTHVLYARVFGNASGARQIHSIQYLASGSDYRDAMVESFAQQGGVGSSDTLQQGPDGQQEYNFYLIGGVSQGEFRILIASITKESYQEMRQDGIARRDARAAKAKEKSEPGAATVPSAPRINHNAGRPMFPLGAPHSPAFRDSMGSGNQVPQSGRPFARPPAAPDAGVSARSNSVLIDRREGPVSTSSNKAGGVTVPSQR